MKILRSVLLLATLLSACGGGSSNGGSGGSGGAAGQGGGSGSGGNGGSAGSGGSGGNGGSAGSGGSGGNGGSAGSGGGGGGPGGTMIDTLAGDITANAVACGAVMLTGKATVKAGATLTLCAGATVTAAKGAELDVEGTLLVQGEKGKEVTFTGAATADVVVKAGGAADVRYASLSGASRAFAVAAGAGTVTLDHVTIAMTVQAFNVSSTITASRVTIHGRGASEATDTVTLADGNSTFTDLLIDGGSLTGADAVNCKRGNPTFDHVTIGGFHCSLHFDSGLGATVTSSKLSGSQYSFMWTATKMASVHGSDLSNESSGVEAISSNGALDMTGNYWGGTPKITGGDKAKVDTGSPLPSAPSDVGVRPEN